jgi:hypothetical protein
MDANGYEGLCEQTLRNQEALVAEIRHQAASAGGDDIWRALRHHEQKLSELRLHIAHTIPDPVVARRIIHSEN